MRYVNFISDGDSSSFKAVTALSDNNGPYGENHTVKKEVCQSRIQATWYSTEKPETDPPLYRRGWKEEDNVGGGSRG